LSAKKYFYALIQIFTSIVTLKIEVPNPGKQLKTPELAKHPPYRTHISPEFEQVQPDTVWTICALVFISLPNPDIHPTLLWRGRF
jgi:hypothetical protein